MHMADALLSPAVGAAMCAVSAGCLGYSAVQVRRDELAEKKLPMMAVAGAFVFAAQMINFTIPGTGSSGHIGGGMLLAALLGGAPAMLTIAAVLIVQCLFFADGGLLALGCNLFNMGVIPCLVVYPLVFQPLTRKGFTARRLSVASVLSVVVALQIGSLGVVVETAASGIAQLPFGAFAAVMQPIHLAIGLVEGIVTGAVLCFVHQMRPEVLAGADAARSGSPKKLLAALSIAALVMAGGLSLLASANPDGLEWSIERVAGAAEFSSGGALHEAAARAQAQLAVMPDYAYAGDVEAPSGTSAAGVLGAALTFAVAGGIGFGISRAKKRNRAKVGG